MNRSTHVLLAAMTVWAVPASAERLVGLVEGNRLVTLDTMTGVIGGTRMISGLGGEMLVGLDLRPVDQRLYGLASSGALFRIDRSSGGWSATELGAITTALTGANLEIDFNPVPNRLRVVSNANQSLRINIDAPASPGGTAIDGSFAYSDGGTPAIVAAAYANNVAGAMTTTFYAVDAARNQLVIVNPPNAGTLTSPVTLDFTIGAADPIGFDISGRTGSAFVSAAGNLHRLNLATGQTAVIGSFGSLAVTDITALNAVPEPASWAMMISGFGGVGAMQRRHRRIVAA